ncbi:hypothetical protein MVES1_003961 [Malassezia vespertilionis]|uniref:Tes1p n=1 Tax=Malassezia vespertilionis TaxID=2020962 RepID=A0A2N1J7X7_9BASI|nr:uncharacterized protein MVES1_003961 [Malassezia vespertilionis]PKI82665.1 hypothetical protein MVES_003513 [Malassezia vespertilionis]WFD08585.1 hypothetical protein MVES1_003961 [Malassezia vespertilionis]
MGDTSLLRLIGVRKTNDPWVFEGVSLPGRAGNLQPIAYGGCAVGTAIISAGHTFSPEARLVPYSVVGQFLGPASLSQPFVCYVTPMRDTRTFVTRHVIVKQRSKKGDLRSVLALTLDMIASPNSTKAALEKSRAENKHPAAVNSVLHYQPKPRKPTNNVEQLMDPDTYVAMRIERGEVDESVVGIYQDFLDLWSKLFEGRVVEDNILSENFMGMLNTDTSQDGLPLLERRSWDWFRAREPLSKNNGSETMSEASPDGLLPVSNTIAQTACLALAMDGMLAFMPLSMAKLNLAAASAASSMDFALRLHSDVFDMNAWHLREARPVAAGWQRTFTEAMLYDEEGTLIASASQQCVLRPAEGEPNAKM